MVSSLGFILCFSLLSIRSTKAVTPSSGCLNPPSNGLGSTLKPGDYENFQRKVPNTQQRTHRLHLPVNYGFYNVVSPVLLYFHGHTGNHNECGETCSKNAVENGFVTVSMTGYGPKGWNSWKHGGSAYFDDRSPDPTGSSVCNENTLGICSLYEDSGCGNKCTTDEDSNCWWTTCYDSVEQVMTILDEVEQSLCVDLDQIWAAGCSNGGMFTFELARDSRSASRLKGIVPIVGLPHYGYSEGPLVDSVKMIGMWGRNDGVVPPISNTNNPDKTLDEDGLFYYTSSNKVMSDWTAKKGCTGNGQDPIDPEEDWSISSYKKLSCTQGCSETNDPIVGCVFDGGHECYWNLIWKPVFKYMRHGSLDNDVNCVNKKTFRYDNKEKKTCKWIDKTKTRRQKLCKIKSVVDNCPSVCYVCCANDKTFKFELDSGKEKTCSWLNKKYRIKKYCPKGQIKTQCPENCGICKKSFY